LEPRSHSERGPMSHRARSVLRALSPPGWKPRLYGKQGCLPPRPVQESGLSLRPLLSNGLLTAECFSSIPFPISSRSALLGLAIVISGDGGCNWQNCSMVHH
jgi:hypothetical protein